MHAGRCRQRPRFLHWVVFNAAQVLTGWRSLLFLLSSLIFFYSFSTFSRRLNRHYRITHRFIQSYTHTQEPSSDFFSISFQKAFRYIFFFFFSVVSVMFISSTFAGCSNSYPLLEGSSSGIQQSTIYCTVYDVTKYVIMQSHTHFKIKQTCSHTQNEGAHQCVKRPNERRKKNALAKRKVSTLTHSDARSGWLSV